MSKPQKNPVSPANRQLDPISRFAERYGLALADAHVQAEHTACEGWQELYAGQLKAQRERRRRVAAELRSIADLAEAAPLNPDDVKALSAAKGECVAVADEAAAFERQTVAPVRAAVERCDELVVEAMRDARMDEERTPLVNVGLEELMRTAVAKQPRPKWDADTGVVTIKPAPLA